MASQTPTQRSTAVNRVNDPLFGMLLGWKQAGDSCRVLNICGFLGAILIGAFLSGGNIAFGFEVFLAVVVIVFWITFWIRVNVAVREGISHGRNA